MESETLSLVLKYFQIYGYYFLFLVLLLENTIVVGLLVPGETVLLAASFLSYQGYFDLERVLIIAALGATIGNNIGYIFGRVGGRPLIERFGAYVGVSPKTVRAAEEYFTKHGGKTVFIGRFASGIRVFVSLLAGASHMNYSRFFVYTLAAVITWTVLIGSIGFFFGSSWGTILTILKRLGWFTLIILVVFVFLYLYLRRKKGN